VSFQKDKKLEELLTGKKVAIVGPSPHLLGKGIGPLIDEYDVVIRINDIMNTKFSNDYGTRNDVILYSCPSLYLSNFAAKLDSNEEQARKIKLLYCPVLKAQHDGGGSVVENFKKINKYDIPFSNISSGNYYYFFNKVGAEPNSGQTAIMMILEYPIEELFVTGFSFYVQYTDNNKYGDCYYNFDYYCPNRKFPPTSSPLLGHQQPPQVAHFKNTLFPHHKEKIIVDSFLNSLLELKHNKVVDLKNENTE